MTYFNIFLITHFVAGAVAAFFTIRSFHTKEEFKFITISEITLYIMVFGIITVIGWIGFFFGAFEVIRNWIENIKLDNKSLYNRICNYQPFNKKKDEI